MTDFKTGDRVRITKANTNGVRAQVGDTGVIVRKLETHSALYRVRFGPGAHVPTGDWNIDGDAMELADAVPGFVVGDKVRVTRDNPNRSGFYKGAEFTIARIKTERGHTYYLADYNGGVTASNLELITQAPKKVSWRDLTQQELAERCVKIARKYAEEHALCSVVDDCLNEIGLGDLIGKRLEVTFHVEVPEGSSWETIKAAIDRQEKAAVVSNTNYFNWDDSDLLPFADIKVDGSY